MDISALLNLIPSDQAKWLRLQHPRAYITNRQGMRSGIIRYDLWFLVDPDRNPSELSEGKTPEEAFEKAFYKENSGLEAL